MSKLNRYMLTWCILVACWTVLFSTFVAPIVGGLGNIVFSGIFGLYSWDITSWFTGIKVEDLM